MLIVPKCKSFAKVMIKYLHDQWINGPFSPKLWNMFLHKEARTNNRCEGYNFQLESKKMLSKHPNVYVLACTIRDKLIVAQDNAMGNLISINFHHKIHNLISIFILKFIICESKS